MKKIKYIALTFFFALVFTNCEDDNQVFINPDINSTGSISYSETTFELSKANASDEVLTINWEAPDFGYNAVPTYQLVFDKTTNLAEPQIIQCNGELSRVFTHQSLNSIALALGLNPAEVAEMYVRLQVKLGTGIVYNSEVKALTITPYSASLDLSTTWGIVGSGYNDWGATPDAPFFKTSEDGVLVAYVNLLDGEIKFRENSDWANNYGDDGVDGSLEAGGANIAVTAGSYKVTMNLNTLQYTIEPFSLGIVGSGYNDWGDAGKDFQLTYDQYSDTFKGIVNLLDGEIKFRLNNKWGTDFGGENEILASGGSNIPVTYGNYIVTVDLNNNKYLLEPIDNIWGLVGSAAPNGWDGPNFKFTRDWSKPDKDIWVLTATVTDGEIKFRANDAWAVNYGDDGDDGSLEAGGANIPITAGTYKFVLDFSNPNLPTYTKTLQ